MLVQQVLFVMRYVFYLLARLFCLYKAEAVLFMSLLAQRKYILPKTLLFLFVYKE